MKHTTAILNTGLQYSGIEPLEESLNKFIRILPKITNSIDAILYVNRLHKDIRQCIEKGSSGQVIEILKKEIENLCFISELFFTNEIIESFRGGIYLYSCSSLVDAGICAYLSNPGWLTLLRTMGMASRKGGRFLRTFFIEVRKLDMAELIALEKIISCHLKCGVDVALLDQKKIPLQYMTHSNMAWLNNSILISATDQIQWDLDITQNKSNMSTAREKYNFFETNATYLFTNREINFLSFMLSEIFQKV